MTTLHSFVGPPNGVSPCGSLVQGRDGNFYGTAAGGGLAEQGSIFVITPSGELTTLYTFSASSGLPNAAVINTDGAQPTAGLVLGRDGNFYGTTTAGGTYGQGTVFCITPGGTLNTLHSFNNTDGGGPSSALIQGNDGRFYGVTLGGGQYGNGTAFAITSAGVLITLHHFTNDEGDRPAGPLLQGSNGNFYGTLSDGQFPGGGVYSMTAAGDVTILHSFSSGTTDGFDPTGGLIQGSDGNIYGTTSRGGTTDSGTIFRLTPEGSLTTLHVFYGPTDGMLPNSQLVQRNNGTLYGVTSNTAFSITPAGDFEVLAHFDGNTTGPGGAGSGLVVGADGEFYGVLPSSNSANRGLFYAMTDAGNVTALHTFNREGGEGCYVANNLILGNDGNLYGTADVGGASYQGTVFKMSLGGVFSIIHQFGSSAASPGPQGGLVQGRDGKFYGTSCYTSSVFSITADGTFNTFYNFPADGKSGVMPHGSLIQGSDGKLYGTTFAGGANTAGTVFSLTSGATLTTLHSFGGNFQGGISDGALPYSQLTQGSDGNFYGTTQSGGTAGNGTVFVVTPGGAYQTLHSFTGKYSSASTGNDDGSEPYHELVQGSDGNFYGTTNLGGTYISGTAFVMTPSGALTVLHSFGGGSGDGAGPGAGLLQVSGGNFYGSTGGGGTYGKGTVFMLTPGGAVTTLYSFAGPDGSGPDSTLVKAGDGNYYGTTYAGGLYNLGTIYRLTPGSTSTTPASAPDAQIICASPSGLSQADNGDVFTLTVGNVGNADAEGPITVSVTSDDGLWIAALSGPGWTCTQDANRNSWTCTRANALLPGHRYPSLTALVNVSPEASTTQPLSLTSHVAVTGDNNAANDTAYSTFTINPVSSTPSQRWRYQYFHTTANAGSASDPANPTGDGLNNLLKYALGLDPTVPETSSIVVDTTTGYLRLTASRNPAATDVSLAVQVTGNLVDPLSWTSNGVTIAQDTATLLQASDSVPLTSKASRYIRLQVSRSLGSGQARATSHR